ncbi:sensor histidine kinase [Mesorhizobium loti]|uniref:histidine kinase n=1 Tax=Mesorhizobium loti R88b TaxID=935548 RepID=A0A6M7WPK2_RHILI|nr:sensor histidine kinase [Mesorhizobium loti]QKD02539.1 sensor histidine kinase [Mesorhizobium loti R88b]
MTAEQRKLPFKVSAKAARLIGRENVANAEGAIVELVKNTYDADADNCLLILDRRYNSLPEQISDAERSWLSVNLDKFDDVYVAIDAGWRLKPDMEPEIAAAAENVVRQALDLWIIDNGKGMSAKIIEDYWMVIGTNFKEENVFSDDGRVRTGAKGIGRFALDRLGTFCELHSSRVAGDTVESLQWSVDWSAFEGPGKTLDEVNATLVDTSRSVRDVIRSLSCFEHLKKRFEEVERNHPWKTGTAICVSGLRDPWTAREVSHLRSTLSSLVPPAEQPPLALFLMDSRAPEGAAEVVSGAPSDFDYRLHAEVASDGGVAITIDRNELRVEALGDAVFERQEMQRQRFNRDSFTKPVKYQTNLAELFAGASEMDLATLRGIGPLSFTLSFYKRTLPSSEDTKRYPYRSFEPSSRAKWLDTQGGIKIYRDDFIVRPYGEPDGKGFDWLRLGQRVAANPVQASRKGWRANPQSLAGTIKISRATNRGLNDQSNREGLIENDTFRAFSTLMIRLIKEFEDDRSYILFNLNESYKTAHPAATAIIEAKSVADRIERSATTPSREDAVTMVRAYRAQVEEIRELNSERGMLRALATLGTVLISFSHEMGQLQSSLENRATTLAQLLKRHITPEMLDGISDEMNPFEMLKDAEATDRKIKQWFKFALFSIKADKRSWRAIKLRDQLRTIQSGWHDFLDTRQIALNVEFADGYDPVIRALEIDLDSIFNNLLLNSVEAFVLRNHGGARVITIQINRGSSNAILIDYRDSGPGIDPNYRNVSQIFNFGETTKTGIDGNGTGIGMWILDSVVKEYGGRVEAFRPSADWGFKAEIQLPERRTERA